MSDFDSSDFGSASSHSDPSHSRETSGGSSGPESLLQPSPHLKPVSLLAYRQKLFIALGILGASLIAGYGYYRFKDKSELKHLSHERDPMADHRPVMEAGLNLKGSNRSWSLQDLRGHVAIITFWKADCQACLIEAKSFQKLLETYKDHDLRALGVNLDTQVNHPPPENTDQAITANSEEVFRIWKDGKFGFDTVVDPDQTSTRELQVESLPATVVLDKKGRRAFISQGSNDWNADETLRLIEDLLAEAP